jgi:hypothetical protein
MSGKVRTQVGCGCSEKSGKVRKSPPLQICPDFLSAITTNLKAQLEKSGHIRKCPEKSGLKLVVVAARSPEKSGKVRIIIFYVSDYKSFVIFIELA